MSTAEQRSRSGATARGGSQTDVVIDGVRDLIRSGRLGAGSRLPIEKDLAAQLGVSRGSLREGVRALAALGILESRQGDGTYVTALDPDLLLSPVGFLADLQGPSDSAQLLRVRRILETESAALAATALSEAELDGLERILDEVEQMLDADEPRDLEAFIDADTAFHRTIARSTGNATLAALIEALVGRTFRARLWRAVAEQGAVTRTQHEHRAILAELRRRDPDRARIRMSVHLLGVEEFAIDHAAPPEVPEPSAGDAPA